MFWSKMIIIQILPDSSNVLRIKEPDLQFPNINQWTSLNEIYPSTLDCFQSKILQKQIWFA